MDPTYPDNRTRRRGGAIAITIGVHAAMVMVWQMTRPVPENGPAPDRMVFWFVDPAKPVPEPVPAREKAQPVAQKPAADAPRPARPPAASPAAAMTMVPQEPAPAPVEPVADAPAAPPSVSADEIMRQARRDIGGIDRDLRGQARKGMVQAPLSSPQKRMKEQMELAAELAPPGLFEAPKIKEVVDPGGYGRKRYRVITANGTYCLTYENAATRSNGMDMAKPPNQRKTNCDPDEQPPTYQP